jgi:hypothetical protein
LLRIAAQKKSSGGLIETRLIAMRFPNAHVTIRHCSMIVLPDLGAEAREKQRDGHEQARHASKSDILPRRSPTPREDEALLHFVNPMSCK